MNRESKYCMGQFFLCGKVDARTPTEGRTICNSVRGPDFLSQRAAGPLQRAAGEEKIGPQISVFLGKTPQKLIDEAVQPCNHRLRSAGNACLFSASSSRPSILPLLARLEPCALRQPCRRPFSSHILTYWSVCSRDDDQLSGTPRRRRSNYSVPLS